MLAVITAGLVWETTRLAYSNALNDLITTGSERVTLIDGTLRAALNRCAYLPYVLSKNRDIHRLLETGEATDYVNRYLEQLNHEAQSEALFIMDSSGDTVASSNWNQPQTYFGENYAFRPYFRFAKAGKRGWHYGVGATTGIPGYFMSHPISQGSRFLGAAIVKVDLTPLQEDWKQGETVLVSDEDGVTVLSSRSDWQYQSMRPLTAEQMNAIQAARKYGNRPPELLALTIRKSLQVGQSIVRFNNVQYLMLSRELPEQNWNLHYLMPLAPVETWRRTVTIIGTILALLMLALIMYLRERKQKQISRRKAQEAEAIQAMNLRLQSEIAERTRTEEALREAQEELVQSGKLAALGHMAAGIVHELNQPIAAIRTHAASAQLLIDRKQTEKAKDTFAAISRMTEHMASITSQLKIFAYKAPEGKRRVLVQECLEDALTITAPLIAEGKISLSTHIDRQPMMLAGNRVRLRQVFINLIHNAMDAMRDSATRVLEITAISEGKIAKVSIRDSGAGIAEQALNELFTPFYTTKEVGEGLGLGLSISYRIISDLGGSIRARNLPDGGLFHRQFAPGR